MRNKARALSWLVALAAVLGGSAQAGNPLPPDVSMRVGLAQTWIYRWTAEQYRDALGTRDFIWSNDPGSLQGGATKLWFPPGSFSGFYISVTRIPAKPRRYGPVTIISACGGREQGCPLSWFQANHPEWIVLKRDQATPAYQYNDPTWVPLDISNPEVQTWIEANFVKPVLAAGYQGISIDNVSVQNAFNEEGVCSVAVVTGSCASNGGTWRRLYSGDRYNDATFVANRVAWLERLTRFAHSHNASTTANVTYDPRDKQGTARLIKAVDIWYNEEGFNGSNPATCQVGGGPKHKIFDEGWTGKVSFIENLRGKPMVQEAAICPLGSPDRHVVEYAMASYYITKSTRTYVAPHFGSQSAYEDQLPGGAWADFSYRHGSAVDSSPIVIDGIYKRAFANLLALVNPSSTASATYDLGGAYHDLDGVRHTGRITLPPRTGRTLLPGAPR